MTTDDLARQPGQPLPDDLAGQLGRAFPDEPDRLRALGEQLAAAAERDGTLDVAHRTVDSPIGSLLLAATPEGVVRVAFAAEGHEAVLHELADLVSPRVLRAPARLDPFARQLEEYFAGRRRRFEVSLDWRLSSGFRRTVLGHLVGEVGYGHTASYAALARLAGNPRAVRAVGTACASNPLPLVVPCHRVVRSDGGIGGYRGGPEAKRTLLQLEAAS